MTREILTEFGRAGLQLASATSEIVGLPPVKVELTSVDETVRA
jgi:hypothetical protein